MIELTLCSWKPGPGTFWAATYIIAVWTGTCGSFSIWTTSGGTHGIWSD
jgi:hypothetical protein